MNVTTKKQQSSANLGYLLILLSSIAWGTEGFFVTKLGQLGASSFLIAFYGLAFAVAPLLIYILITQGLDGLKISKQGLLYAFLIGIFTKGCFKLAFNSSIQFVGMSTAAVLGSTGTIWTAVLSVIFLKERLYKNNYLAILINIVGVFLMVTMGNFSNLNLNVLGLLLGLIAGFLNGVASILTKKATSHADHPTTVLFYSAVVASIFLALISQPWKGPNIDLLANRSFLYYAVALGLITGFISNVFYFMGMATDVDASKTPIIASIDTVVASIVGVIAFGEAMNLYGVLGIVLIFLSIVLMNQQPAYKRL